MAEENGVDLDLQAVKEQGLKINKSNRAYTPGRIIGVECMANILIFMSI